jgi:hypothetical protein
LNIINIDCLPAQLRAAAGLQSCNGLPAKRAGTGHGFLIIIEMAGWLGAELIEMAGILCVAAA